MRALMEAGIKELKEKYLESVECILLGNFAKESTKSLGLLKGR